MNNNYYEKNNYEEFYNDWTDKDNGCRKNRKDDCCKERHMDDCCKNMHMNDCCDMPSPCDNDRFAYDNNRKPMTYFNIKPIVVKDFLTFGFPVSLEIRNVT